MNEYKESQGLHISKPQSASGPWPFQKSRDLLLHLDPVLAVLVELDSRSHLARISFTAGADHLHPGMVWDDGEHCHTCGTFALPAQAVVILSKARVVLGQVSKTSIKI